VAPASPRRCGDDRTGTQGRTRTAGATPVPLPPAPAAPPTGHTARSPRC